MPITQDPQDMEECWENLLVSIDEGKVIPVIGAELLTVMESGRSIPLYSAVAERLLKELPIPTTENHQQKSAATTGLGTDEPGSYAQHELNSAVCAIMDHRHVRNIDIYGKINRLIKKILEDQKSEEYLKPLLQLAGIRKFNLFVTTTSDDRLATALNQERFKGAPGTEEICFYPASSDRNDIPEPLPPTYAAVFYLFGKTGSSPRFAIHDEDMLEFIYTLQDLDPASGSEDRIKKPKASRRFLSEVRDKNILLIGCSNLADWLSPFFIRLCSKDRLNSNRDKREFLVRANSPTDPSLTIFLERFSQNTYIFPLSAQDFVKDLSLRWLDRHPPPPSDQTDLNPMDYQSRESIPSIFISYAREDFPAAWTLYENLQKIATDTNVTWIDHRNLEPGDGWERKIRTAIKNCNLFLPLISANTENRTEGYFREEWKQADERDRKISGKKFIIPIVIDEQPKPMENYEIPDCFKTIHDCHAPNGKLPETLRRTIIRELNLSTKRYYQWDDIK